MIHNVLKIVAGLAALAVLGFAAAAPADTVNDKCPVSQKAVDGSTTSEVDGKTVGFCCGRCKGAFDGWDKARQVAFVESVQGAAQAAEAAPAAPKSAPYLLDVCAVSGEKLGSMGDPIVKEIAGREVKFCCESCVGKYEENPERFAARIDKAMADQQRPYYAMTTCPVSGEPLGDEPEQVVVGNRLILTCCGMCAKKVAKDPARAIAMVEEANAAAQAEHYPLTDCPVSGEALGSMGDPVEQVVAGRLVKLCCKGCVRGMAKDPAAVIAKIDAAWKPIHARKAGK